LAFCVARCKSTCVRREPFANLPPISGGTRALLAPRSRRTCSSLVTEYPHRVETAIDCELRIANTFAKLPVAWSNGNGNADGDGGAPAAYRLRLPARVAEDDQATFAAKYGATCSDPDIVLLPASVRRATENSTGKYPEYARVWDDRELHVVALFSRDRTVDETQTNDDGLRAYSAFVARVRDARSLVAVTGEEDNTFTPPDRRGRRRPRTLPPPIRRRKATSHVAAAAAAALAARRRRHSTTHDGAIAPLRPSPRR
jgi:hypothetical protein